MGQVVWPKANCDPLPKHAITHQFSQLRQTPLPLPRFVADTGRARDATLLATKWGRGDLNRSSLQTAEVLHNISTRLSVC
jgi:hypothetical protein